MQDVETRWNSSYYMLEWLQRNKNPLSLALNAIDCQDLNLNGVEWRLCANLIDILAPVEQATLQGSHEGGFSHAGLVIPIVQSLKCNFKAKPGDLGVCAFKSGLYASISKRYINMYENEIYLCCTALDPRFKTALFSADSTAQVKEILVGKLAKVKGNGTDNEAESGTPPMKKMKFDALWDCLDIEDSPQSSASASDTNDEVEVYFSSPKVSRNTDPISWWADVGVNRYPNLAKVAKSYLCIPCSSVPRERVFSIAGLTITNKRASLTPEKADMLICLRMNRVEFDWKY